MKERPIIFNSEMVRAILSGQKTQTRRIVKPQPDEDGLARLRGGPWMDTSEKIYRCPFGEIGDRLYVRETVHAKELESGLDVVCYPADQAEIPIKAHPLDAGLWIDLYRYRGGEGKIVPSIHMPRWASRILLDTTDVRVERLNDISEEDARAEGVEQLRGGYWRHYQPGWTQHQLSARGSFATIWKSIYGEESWVSNPWCWVIEFKHINKQ
ncbi:hypothetical protein [Brenneria corticis]|uniref:Morphogenetic protein n=1 Tax=Brenneria corticis TaxID=2173106 RepID=A0A2U1TM87_9GAMM|nr:hypothetical protein [Brenneria sp. CFCC 11842]PWC10506.1 hypothetical protein DDT56_21565 [Brenneria sp. CFCC 11842]